MYDVRKSNQGQAFEAQIKADCTGYEIKGLALVHKREVAAKPRYNRQTKDIEGMIYTERSTLDFEGVAKVWPWFWTPEKVELAQKRPAEYPGAWLPVPVALEAKDTGLDYLPLSNIADHQIDYMEAAPRWNIITGLLFVTGKGLTYYMPGRFVVDAWNTWQSNKGKRGTPNAIIPGTTPGVVRCPVGHGAVFDWLPIMLADRGFTLYEGR